MNENPNFIGSHFYTVDTKNRLAIPAKFRAAIADQPELVLAQGLEGCLNLYTKFSWKRIGEKLESFPLKNKAQQRAFKRLLFANACEVQCDEEGRILIPQHLIDYAGLKKETAIVGHGEKIEIWSMALWTKYVSQQKSVFKKFAAQLEF